MTKRNTVYTNETKSILFINGKHARAYTFGETAHYLMDGLTPPGLDGLTVNPNAPIGSIPFKSWKPIEQTYDVPDGFEPGPEWDLGKDW